MTIYIIAGESISQIEWDDRYEPKYDIWFSSLEDANDYLEHLLLDWKIYTPFKWAVWGLKSTNYTWDDRWYGLDIKINYRATEE